MNQDNRTVGIIGVGLMGSSIAADMLMQGQQVVGLSPVDSEADAQAYARIERQLSQSYSQGLVAEEPAFYLAHLHLTKKYQDLQSCYLVIESVVEDLTVKEQVLRAIEDAVSSEAIVTSNTSAIPINVLQGFLIRPERFFGMHWSQPSFTNRFLEIICGDQSDLGVGESLYQIAEGWGKEPTLLRKDIRGFVTNRLMYALYREALSLVDQGYVSMEDLDRTCKNDAGRWMTFCGPFRYMDLTGLQAYYHVMKDLFPTLSNRTDVPAWLGKIAEEGGNGTSNGRGFYDYTEEESRQWEQSFEAFAYDISKISTEYHTRITKHQAE